MPARSSIRLGELLVERGVITRDQLNTALQAQNTNGKRLGQTLVRLGYANESAILNALTTIAATEKPEPPSPAESTAFPKVGLGGAIAGVSVLAICLLSYLVFFVFENDVVASPRTSTPPPTDFGRVDDALVSTPVPVGKVQTVDKALTEVSFKVDEPLAESELSEDHSLDNTGYLEVVVTADADGLVTTEGASSQNVSEQHNTLENRPSTQESVHSTIEAIRTSASRSDMRVVFESTTSIQPTVERIYLNQREVMYLFHGFSLSDTAKAEIENTDWLSQSHFEQTESALVWAFTMVDEGDAKYHELSPATNDDLYRFVVILRKH